MLFLIGGQRLSANPLKSPRRLINNQTVDLNPLFKWWTNHASARPLTGWVHVTGAIVGTNAWGWVLEGKADRSPARRSTEESSSSSAPTASKILLLHPPLQDLAEFSRLRAELQTLNAERQQIVDQETQAKNRAQAVAQQQKVAGRNNPQYRALSQEAKQLGTLSTQAKSQIQILDLQIQPLKNKLAMYAESERYVVDCFALDLEREAQGLPVFDHGSVFQ